MPPDEAGENAKIGRVSEPERCVERGVDGHVRVKLRGEDPFTRGPGDSLDSRRTIAPKLFSLTPLALPADADHPRPDCERRSG